MPIVARRAAALRAIPLAQLVLEEQRAMRIRWHKSWLLGFALGGCVLNPQPDLPGNRGSTDTGGGGKSATGGASSAAGSGDIATPGQAGAPGAADAGAIGSAGDSTSLDAGAGGTGPSNEAGAGGEAGLPQLAPGPAR